HARIEICGEEDGLRKFPPESAEDQRLVVDIAAEHPDGLDLSRGTAISGIGREIANMRGEPPQVVDLRGALRALEGLEGARAVRLDLLAIAPRRRSRRARDLAVEATEIAEATNPGWPRRRAHARRPGLADRRLERLGKLPAVRGVPLGHEDDPVRALLARGIDPTPSE